MSDVSSGTIGGTEPGELSEERMNGERPKEEFAWLDLVEESDCYMPLDASHDRPTKSLDFGQDGVTGSLTAWHELLQVTAPDDECGLVFIRGAFPDHAGAVLARAQRRNDTGTFGLELRIDEDSGFVLERTSSQGMINLRWPYSRFNFVPRDGDKGERDRSEPKVSMCSFVQGNVLYQIHRVTPSKKFSSAPNSPNSSRVASVETQQRTLAVQIGGKLRFGCPNTVLAAVPGGNPMPQYRNTGGQAAKVCGSAPQFLDTYRVKHPGKGMTPYVLACESIQHQHRLEMRLWIDGEQEELIPTDCSVEPGQTETVTLRFKRPLEISEEEAVNIIAAFSLVPSSDEIKWGKTHAVRSDDIEKHLGYADDSLAAPYRLWSRIFGVTPTVEDDAAFATNTIGRCVEGILSVLSVPVKSKYSRACLCSGSCECKSHHTEGESPCIALTKTIIDCQVVDLETTLWHVRLLVAAYRALDKMSVEPLKATYDETYFAQKRVVPYHDMREDYRSRIAERLRGIVKWVLNVLPVLADEANDRHYHKTPILMTDVNRFSALRNAGRQTNTDRDRQSTRTCRACLRNALPNTDKTQIQGRRLRNQKWFCALIICYLMQQDSSVLKSKDITKELQRALPLFDKIRNRDDASHLMGSEDPYTCLIRSYHSYSIAQIAKAPQLDPNDVNIDRHLACGRSWQGKAERSMRRLDQGRFAHHCVGHEVANIALIVREITTKDDCWHNENLLVLIKKMVESRQETEKVMSGSAQVRRFEAGNVRSGTPYPAPWELSCLGHHLPLNLDLHINDEECMEECKKFLLADYTFTPTWDHSKASTVGLWWDLSTSSIICTKLLVENRKGHALSIANATVNTEEANGTQSVPEQNPYPSADKTKSSADQEDSEMIKVLKQIRDGRVPRHRRRSDLRDGDVPTEWLKGQKKMVELLTQSNGKDPDLLPGINWRKRRPPVLYHPDTFVQSLEDTPKLYGKNQRRNVPLRPNIKKCLAKTENTTAPLNLTLEDIKSTLPPEALRHVSLFDLSLMTSDNDAPEIGISCVRGRADESWKTKCSDACQQEIRRVDFVDGKVKSGEASRPDAWDLYFLDQDRLYPSWYGLSGDEPDKSRGEILGTYQESLLTVLNDSLVDLGTKYRILFTHSLSPATLQAFIYMWHPDALDTFDNQLGTLSHFHDGRSQLLTGAEDMWTTSITISHWRLLNFHERFLSELEKNLLLPPRENKERLLRLFHQPFKHKLEHRETDSDRAYDDIAGVRDPISITPFPPKNVHDERQRPELSTIREQSVSLVITGDVNGRYWTCTMICDLIDEKTMKDHVETANNILQAFIHQQYTGRALVFIHLLGNLCESLAKECEKFTAELDNIIDIHPMLLLLKGLQWHTSDVALDKLREMLWGYEALSVFNDKLRESVNKVDEARVKMKHTLDLGQEIRPADLKRTAEGIVTEFDKRFSRLCNVHEYIRQRIDQGTRLREGMTSVLGVDQNEHIGMLTWVSIIYLPLAFVIALFSMSNEYIVLEHAPPGTFIGLMVGLTLGTVVLAIYLRNIRRLLGLTRRQLRKIFTTEERVFGKLPQMPPSAESSKSGPLVGARKRRSWSRRPFTTPQDIEEGANA